MHRIDQPTIIGNVLAGIIVGPALLALVDPIDAIDLFISIGVFFLIGLEEIDLPGFFRRVVSDYTAHQVMDEEFLKYHLKLS